MSQSYKITLVTDDVNTQSYLFKYIVVIKLPINESRKVIVFCRFIFEKISNIYCINYLVKILNRNLLDHTLFRVIVRYGIPRK